MLNCRSPDFALEVRILSGLPFGVPIERSPSRRHIDRDRRGLFYRWKELRAAGTSIRLVGLTTACCDRTKCDAREMTFLPPFWNLLKSERLRACLGASGTMISKSSSFDATISIVARLFFRRLAVGVGLSDRVSIRTIIRLGYPARRLPTDDLLPTLQRVSDEAPRDL